MNAPLDFYRVIGVGRIGSHVKAKQGGYSRNRQYWAIGKWSNDCSDYCLGLQKRLGHHELHYPQGHVEDKAHGRFRTKKAAEEYLVNLEKYVTAEVKLATLLGWTEITRFHSELAGNFGEKLQVAIPRWTRDSGAALDLAIEHDVDFQSLWANDGTMIIQTTDLYGNERWTHVAEHGSKAVAVRYALATGVIAMLEYRTKMEASQGTMLESQGAKI